MLAAVVLVGLLTAPSSVAAPRECGYTSLQPEFPRYARTGGVIDIRVRDYSRGSTQFSGSVQVDPLGPAPVGTYPLKVTDVAETSSGSNEGHIYAPAPAAPNRRTKVILTWTEVDDPEGYPPGFTSECTARAAEEISVVPPGGEVGDPSWPRFEGRFRVFYRLRASGIPGADKRDRGIWRLRPRCRYFGCETRLRSSLGLRGTFDFDPPGDFFDYGMSRTSGRRAYCSGVIINRFTGEVIRRWKIRRAYRLVHEVKLRVARDPETFRVTGFSGKSVFHFEPIPSAERRGCPDKYVVEGVRGRLIGS